MTAPGTHGVFSCSGHLHRTAGNPGGEMRTPSSAGRVSLICEGGNAGVFRRKLWELACWERESLSADRKARVSGGRGLASRPYGLHISGCPCPRICQQFPWQLFSAQTWRPPGCREGRHLSSLPLGSSREPSLPSRLQNHFFLASSCPSLKNVQKGRNSVVPRGSFFILRMNWVRCGGRGGCVSSAHSINFSIVS